MSPLLNPCVTQARLCLPYTSEDEAKDAFVQFAVSKYCCRTATAKHMVVRSLTALNTLNKEVMLVCTTVQ